MENSSSPAKLLAGRDRDSDQFNRDQFQIVKKYVKHKRKVKRNQKMKNLKKIRKKQLHQLPITGGIAFSKYKNQIKTNVSELFKFKTW